MILVRGSGNADLTTVDVLTDTPPDYSPWGLEPIDAIDQTSPRYLSLSLAAEPQGDGILLEDWTGKTAEIRVRVLLEDAPLIGTPIRDAVSGKWLGVNSLRLGAWSRDFWRLSRPTRFDAEVWWNSTTAGADLLWVNANEAPPIPARLDR